MALGVGLRLHRHEGACLGQQRRTKAKEPPSEALLCLLSSTRPGGHCGGTFAQGLPCRWPGLSCGRLGGERGLGRHPSHLWGRPRHCGGPGRLSLAGAPRWLLLRPPQGQFGWRVGRRRCGGVQLLPALGARRGGHVHPQGPLHLAVQAEPLLHLGRKQQGHLRGRTGGSGTDGRVTPALGIWAALGRAKAWSRAEAVDCQPAARTPCFPCPLLWVWRPRAAPEGGTDVFGGRPLVPSTTKGMFMSINPVPTEETAKGW